MRGTKRSPNQGNRYDLFQPQTRPPRRLTGEASINPLAEKERKKLFDKLSPFSTLCRAPTCIYGSQGLPEALERIALAPKRRAPPPKQLS